MNDTLEQILQQIGDAIAVDVGGDPEGAFLYAEPGPAVLAASLYKDLGDRIVYYDFGSDLCDRVLDAWEIAEPGKEWSAMHYSIADGRFDVHFDYPDDWVEGEYFDQRCDRVVAEKYGNRRIEYPPFGPDEA
jgi:hypothetical protein